MGGGLLNTRTEASCSGLLVDEAAAGGFRWRRRWDGYVLGAADLTAILLIERLFRSWFLHADIVLYSLSNGKLDPTPTGIDFFLVLGCMGLLYFRSCGLYRLRRPIWDETRPVFRFAVAAFVVDGLLLGSAQAEQPIIGALVSWIAFAALVPFLRVMLRRMLVRRGVWRIPTAIVGTGPTALRTAGALACESNLGYVVTRFIAVDPEAPASLEADGKRYPVARLDEGERQRLRRSPAEHIVVAIENGDSSVMKDLLGVLALRPDTVDIVPSTHGMPLYGTEVNHLFARELLLLRVRNNLGRRGPALVKRVLDFVGSLVLLMVLSPVLAAIAYGVSLSGRPILFGHTRVGQHGRTFKCLKFRTMVPNAQEVLRDLLARDPQARAEWEKDFKLKNDPRVTRLGEFLRRTSADELPQLFNVLRGDMSLVGPRPVVEAEIARYGASWAHYLQIRPGITGLWQVSGRNDVDYENRVFLDEWYVKNWSVWYDIVILLKTVLVVMRRKGAY